MGDVPTTVNGTVQAVESGLRIVEYDGLVKLAYSALVAQLPFLAWPVLGQIIRWLIGLFADRLFVPLNQAVGKLIIDAQVAAEDAAYNRAISVLATSQASGVNHEQALADARAALGRLIHSDGSG